MIKRVLSSKQISKKHSVSEEMILQQLKMGIEVEKEHTTDESLARKIALHHLEERPDYYSKLKKMESEEVTKTLQKAMEDKKINISKNFINQ